MQFDAACDARRDKAANDADGHFICRQRVRVGAMGREVNSRSESKA